MGSSSSWLEVKEGLVNEQKPRKVGGLRSRKQSSHVSSRNRLVQTLATITARWKTPKSSCWPCLPCLTSKVLLGQTKVVASPLDGAGARDRVDSVGGRNRTSPIKRSSFSKRKNRVLLQRENKC